MLGVGAGRERTMWGMEGREKGDICNTQMKVDMVKLVSDGGKSRFKGKKDPLQYVQKTRKL